MIKDIYKSVCLRESDHKSDTGEYPISLKVEVTYPYDIDKFVRDLEHYLNYAGKFYKVCYKSLGSNQYTLILIRWTKNDSSKKFYIKSTVR